MATILSFFNISPKKIDTSADWHLFISDELSKAGDTLIWTMLSSDLDETIKAFERKGLTIKIVPFHKTGVKLVAHLLRLILSTKADLVSLNFIKPLDAVLLIILSKLFLLKVRFTYSKHSPGRSIDDGLDIGKFISPLRFLSFFVDEVICVSNSIKDNCLERRVSPNKLRTIYNGVNIEKYENSVNANKIRREFSISNDFKIISTIKDARPEVGLRDLLYSIPEVLNRYSETVFLIVGGGKETDRLKEISRQLNISDNVIFTGVRHDIPDIIAESYFTIDPSPVEAFGLVIVESMAAMKPVIAVNAFGPSEIVVNNETGLLVEPGSPTNFAPAILELLSSQEKVERMGQKSLERAKEKFHIRNMAKETAKLYLEILKK